MAKCWRITGYSGEQVVFDKVLHGRVGHRQIEEILVRLQTQQMTFDEIVDATLDGSNTLTPIRTLQGSDYTTPTHPRTQLYFTADQEEF